MPTRPVTLTPEEVEGLRAFALLPSWIMDEIFNKYSECNTAPLPVAAMQKAVEKAVEQFEGPEPLKYLRSQSLQGQTDNPDTLDDTKTYLAKLAMFRQRLED